MKLYIINKTKGLKKIKNDKIMCKLTISYLSNKGVESAVLQSRFINPSIEAFKGMVLFNPENWSIISDTGVLTRVDTFSEFIAAKTLIRGLIEIEENYIEIGFTRDQQPEDAAYLMNFSFEGAETGIEYALALTLLASFSSEELCHTIRPYSGHSGKKLRGSIP